MRSVTFCLEANARCKWPEHRFLGTYLDSSHPGTIISRRQTHLYLWSAFSWLVLNEVLLWFSLDEQQKCLTSSSGSWTGEGRKFQCVNVVLFRAWDRWRSGFLMETGAGKCWGCFSSCNTGLMQGGLPEQGTRVHVQPGQRVKRRRCMCVPGSHLGLTRLSWAKCSEILVEMFSVLQKSTLGTRIRSTFPRTPLVIQYLQSQHNPMSPFCRGSSGSQITADILTSIHQSLLFQPPLHQYSQVKQEPTLTAQRPLLWFHVDTHLEYLTRRYLYLEKVRIVDNVSSHEVHLPKVMVGSTPLRKEGNLNWHRDHAALLPTSGTSCSHLLRFPCVFEPGKDTTTYFVATWGQAQSHSIQGACVLTSWLSRASAE